MNFLNLLGIWSKPQRTLRPYLDIKRGGDTKYFTFALQNWVIIGALLYFSLPFFKIITHFGDNKGMSYTTDLTPVVAGTAPSGYLVPPINISVNVTQIVPPINVTYPTGTPSLQLPSFMGYTPTVTHVPFEPSQINFVFSYYDPSLVGKDYEKYKANCHVDNLLYNQTGRVIGCKDTTASGERWSLWRMFYASNKSFMGGVAVPYYPGTSNPLYPMYSIIHVSAPNIITGDYMVIDICPACDDYASDKNVLFLDFDALGLPDGVTFWTPVKVDRVTYPYEVVTPTLIPPSTLIPVLSPTPTPTEWTGPD